MKTTFAFASVVLTVVALFVAASAAPIRRMTPVTVEGTIVEAKWSPAATKEGRPGFSGTLGKDRTFPAHFDVELTNYVGLDAATARRIGGLIGHPAIATDDPTRLPPTIWLRITEENPKALTKGIRIRVSGYHVSGDEGGTWTYHDKPVVIPPPKPGEKKPRTGEAGDD